MKSVIIHGKRVSLESPKTGRPDAELWGVTRSNTQFWNGQLTDWTRWFDLHPIERTTYYPGVRNIRPKTLWWYAKQGATKPIYLLKAIPEVVASVTFPLDAVLKEFPREKHWYTCQVDYMIPFAILEGFTHIILNGIGVNKMPEYLQRHAGIPYWIGLARGMGIDIEVDPPSVYRTPPTLYGYEAAPQVLRNKEIRFR